jgi:hypothetical protein
MHGGFLIKGGPIVFIDTLNLKAKGAFLSGQVAFGGVISFEVKVVLVSEALEGGLLRVALLFFVQEGLLKV